MGWMGRARKGTGLAGSDRYSSNAGSPALGAAKLSFEPAVRYSGVGWTVQPLVQPAGHAGRRRHAFVPVSNAETGGTSALRAPALRYWSRNGRRISRRKWSAVSLSNLKGPSVLPSAIS